MGLEIDLSKIETPRPSITDSATSQLLLMKENDWTLEGKDIRISISGKGCDGFDYAIGFDNRHNEDFVYQEKGLNFLFDPFCAFYAQNLEIDFKIDPEKNVDGFVIKSLDQKKHTGKFWRQDESKVLPVKGNS